MLNECSANSSKPIMRGCSGTATLLFIPSRPLCCLGAADSRAAAELSRSVKLPVHTVLFVTWQLQPMPTSFHFHMHVNMPEYISVGKTCMGRHGKVTALTCAPRCGRCCIWGWWRTSAVPLCSVGTWARTPPCGAPPPPIPAWCCRLMCRCPSDTSPPAGYIIKTRVDAAQSPGDVST